MIIWARKTVRRALDAGFWKPGSARLIVATRPGRRRSAAAASPATRLQAAADWLCRAQDATTDGGVSWGYRLRSGWGPSYPETTGYIVPTFLALARTTGRDDYRVRAGRCIDFLARVQLPEGAFPGGMLSADRPQPSVFNTGQIINGLTAWYLATTDERVLDMARRAADWLVSVQEDDGAWRRYGYLDYPVTYTAHASCWLAELGAAIAEDRYRAAAGRHLDWVLSQQDPASGWFERSGFSAADHRARRSVTHTFAYTLWGVVHSGIILDRPDAVAAARRPAGELADLILAERWLPGVVDANWKGQSRYACLTGNAQMALVWMRLADLEPDQRLSAAAARAIELVGAAQFPSARDPGIRGGIPGSDPVFGAYIPNALPNWAAKFYIDALIAQPGREPEKTVPAREQRAP